MRTAVAFNVTEMSGGCWCGASVTECIRPSLTSTEPSSLGRVVAIRGLRVLPVSCDLTLRVTDGVQLDPRGKPSPNIPARPFRLALAVGDRAGYAHDPIGCISTVASQAASYTSFGSFLILNRLRPVRVVRTPLRHPLRRLGRHAVRPIEDPMHVRESPPVRSRRSSRAPSGRGTPRQLADL